MRESNDDRHDLETIENSIYTDDYQTEDAFSQIPASDEFVEEETQEISSIRPKARPAGAEVKFPNIKKFGDAESKRPTRKASEKGRRRKPDPSIYMPFLNLIKNGIKAVKRIPIVQSAKKLMAFPKEVARVLMGSIALSAILLILGFVSLHV